MSRRFRFVGALSITALVLASCGGGGDSSGRTKNSALCYATQEEKDAAVQAARDAFDAAMTGVPTEDAPEETPTSVEEETPTTVEEVVTIPDDPQAFGGGYRRPAVRIGSGGDTSTTVEEQSVEGEGEALTPEQQQAQMDLEAAESQPLCESDSETTEISCTATATLEGVSDDCTDGDVRVEDSNGGEWVLVNVAEDGTETVLAQGTYDVTSVGIDTPVIIPITYTLPGANGSESSSDRCTATFTSTGVSWNCPNGELFNAAIEDMSNQGVFPTVECAASGSFTVAENQQFWFNFSLGGTFYDGYNNNQEQNVAIEFDVPEDVDGICSEYGFEVDDLSALEFSGSSDPQIVNYSFTVPEGLETPVLVRFESESEFDVDIDNESDFEVGPECVDEECLTRVGVSVWDLSPGEYVFEIEDNENVVSWSSNVEISASPVTLPELPFTYETDGTETKFSFKLEEPQVVVLSATAGQTCAANEDDREDNGFADPEIMVEIPGVDSIDDDNSGRGVGNCSASLLDIELDAGTYFVTVEDDDEEGFAVFLNSSVELQQFSIQWSLSETSVSGQEGFEFVVPEGGAFFRAESFTNQLETYTFASDPYASDNPGPIDSAGCANPDGDFGTEDVNCVETEIAIVQEETEVEYARGNSEYDEVSQLNGQWILSWINSFGSEIEIFLQPGTYTLYAIGWVQDEPVGEFTLRYGLGVLGDSQEEVVIETKNVDVPQNTVGQNTVNLPVNSLTQESRMSTAISSTVEEFVCDAACIDAMFIQAGIEDGTILVSAGGDSVTLRKGQKNVVIPVGKHAGEISAVATSADGSTVVQLGSEITELPAEVKASIDSKTVTGSQGDSGSSNLPYLIGLIALLISVGVVIRRKKATQNN
jgi:hypothetical protein